MNLFRIMEYIKFSMGENLEVTDLDQEAIADHILQGYTSGILDSEDENGNSIRLSWELTVNKFIND
jgi:hypothetical protein